MFATYHWLQSLVWSVVSRICTSPPVCIHLLVRLYFILCSDPRANSGDVYVSPDCGPVSITTACRWRELLYSIYQLIYTYTYMYMYTCRCVRGDLVHVHHTCMYMYVHVCCYSLTLCLLFTGVPSIVTT